MSWLSEVLADSPLAGWRLGESSGTTAADGSGHSHPGEYTNAPELGKPGAIAAEADTAVKFNGTNQRVVIPNFTGPGDTFTIEAWVKRTGSGGGEAILHLGVGAAYLRLNAGKPQLLAASTAELRTSTVAVPSDGAFHHVVVTKSGTTIKVYIDGVSQTLTGSSSTACIAASDPYGIAGYGIGGGGEWNSATLDEVWLYGTALSEARVKAHYAAGINKAAAKTLSLTDSTTPTESLTKKVTKGLSDSTTPTETFTKMVTKALGDISAPTESWSFELVDPGPEPEARVRTSVREFPRLDLHYEIKTPNGRYYRWAKDEPSAENVPSGAGFSTTDHGGFDGQNLTLPRKPGVDYADLQRLSTVRALGAGGEVACETRLKEAPRTSGDQIAVSPVAEGWIEHLNDDATAAEIYRDVDLSGWGSPSRARQVALEALNLPPNGSSEVLTDVSSGLPALRLKVEGTWASPTRPVCEVWYDAGPSCKIASGYVNCSGSQSIGFTLFYFNADGDAANVESSADLWVGTPFSGGVALAAPRRYVGWLWFYESSPAGAVGASFPVDLRSLAVYGDHGLPPYGLEPEVGFLGSDVIADAFSRWAPKLNFSTGASGSVRPGTFPIPHLVFKEQTTSLAILEAVNRFELRPYMVWENRTFYWQEWGEGRKWRARVAPTQLSETGPSTSRLRNGVLLKWSDVDGTSRSAGPIGSGCDIESVELEDRDPENPANQIGTPFWGTPYDLGIVTVDSEAIRIGVLLQARLKEVDRSGQAQIVGVCEDDKGVLRPYWQVRAGDTITFIDASDTSERRIIATNSDDDSRTNTIVLDAPAEGVEDLLAQLGVGNTELGL